MATARGGIKRIVVRLDGSEHGEAATTPRRSAISATA